MTALLLIDIQTGLQEIEFYGTERNNSEAETNAQKILDVFRRKNWPIFHVQHSSTNPDSPLHPSKKGHALHPLVTPIDGESIIQKNVNSAFIGTDLESRLKNQNISDLVIVGLTTEHCVSTSVRMAANLGFSVTLISDATAAFDKTGADGKWYSAETIHQTNLAVLKDEFAQVINTATLLEKLAD
ncbi:MULTISPECIES: cysteine hydrolase family protein [Flavobacteriaceae]|uniref:cysteine hydrolase family protein n=1 Tax=Flavobacteriaceae TaxID=49546 RepID=UPI002349EA3D|nr:cysteine hydrolase family protein [Muricauda sp. SP22]MDC6362358.1 cysteine hydrolase family protein [Muricauda sp. SP22]